MNISNKEDAVLLLLNQLDSRHERVIRIYFGLGNEKKKSIEDIGNDFELNVGEVIELKNNAIREFIRLILSTGMSNIKEIKNALKILLRNGLSKKKITLLYCISSYPTHPNEIFLPEIKNFKKKFKINIGFSDHSKGKEAALGSVIMGATIIEKHLTLNNLIEGPDHKASTEPEEFRDMVKSVRNLEKMLIGKKKNRDYLNKKFVRKSLVASRDINKGEIFTEHNIAFKRPMLKNNSNKFFKIIGKKSKKNYFENDLI